MTQYFGPTPDGMLMASADPADYLLSGGTAPGSVCTQHNRFFRTVNAAGTATVRLVGVNNSDEIVIGGEGGTGAQLLLRDMGAAAPGPKTAHQDGIAQMWCDYDTVGTTAVRGSGNVSHLVDMGPGDTKIYFRRPMPSAAYAALPGAGSADCWAFVAEKTAAYVRVRTRTAAGLCDSNLNSVAVFGPTG